MTSILSLFEESRKFKAGEIIIHEGAINRDLYILSDGILEVSVKGGGEKIVVNEITSPEILGEISFLNGTPRTATVTARTDVEMFVLNYDKVQQEISGIPTWFKMILLAFANRMKSCDMKISEYDEKLRSLEKEISTLKKG